ncbi:MAG TPA: hypothetical protein VIC87_02155, partial [Vicinamibacteria bacterium]
PPTPNPRPKTWTVQGCAEPRDDALEPQERRCGTATVRVEPAETTATTLRTSLTGSAQTALAWKSELLVPGASGQIVANGVAAAFASSGQGPVSGVVASRPGPNRIEAQLVQANGKPGTWRFDLSLTSGLVAGSLRVVAGEAVAVTADAIVFGMRGAPGERIVFTFETAN